MVDYEDFNVGNILENWVLFKCEEWCDYYEINYEDKYEEYFRFWCGIWDGNDIF